MSGAEFMQATRDRLPGCVVLDLHMPEMSGFEVQQLLREAKAQVPVLIITGLDTAEARREALTLGARAYLAKPVDGEALARGNSRGCFKNRTDRSPHQRNREVPMKAMQCVVTAIAAAALAGCAGQPQTYDLQGGQSVTVPKGTMLGGASAGQTTALAQEVADTNNNAMAQFGKVENTQNKELATSQAALAKLEQISMNQGAGSITLFFAEGSATLDQFQYQRLVNFLDYLQRESAGRKVILVSIGSASAVGAASVNQKLSAERSQAPLPIISQYLVNIPHQFYKVSAIGDMYAPKNAPMSVEKRYQSVRIIAAYDAAQIGKLGG